MKRQITAYMNISLGDNDNIYQYMCTFVLRGLHSVTEKCYSKYKQQQIIQETEERKLNLML